jgi:hypothetical protein
VGGNDRRVRLGAFVNSNAAWPFSDMDVKNGGGIGISIVPGVNSSPMIDVQTCTSPNGPTFAHAIGSYPDDGTWQFVRVVHTGTNMRVCLNGALQANVDVQTTQLKNMYPPDLGKDVQRLSSEAYFSGSLDDVRAITGALPCE